MINFIKYTKLYIFLSFLIIGPGIFSLVRYGLRPSIDFTGGALIEYKITSNIKHEIINEAAKSASININSIQGSSENNIIIKTAPITQESVTLLKKNIEEKTGQKIEELRFESIGPVLGKELLKKTFAAILFAILAILLYIAWSFKNFTYGISAIGALVHDLLVLFGIFSLLGHFFHVEVDALFVTAVLTSTSFSIHDTIVVFHRIKEIRKSQPHFSFTQTINKALTETMVRSLNNSLTIIFMLLALFLLGGSNTKLFAFALLVGTITGTYSSPFIATPLLSFLSKVRHKRT